MKRANLLLLVLITITSLALVACKKDEEKEDEGGAATIEKVCAHMAEASDGDADEDECKAELPEVVKMCPDQEQEMLDCLMDVKDEDGAKGCMMACMAEMMENEGGGAPE